jgi:hypothetical protein
MLFLIACQTKSEITEPYLRHPRTAELHLLQWTMAFNPTDCIIFDFHAPAAQIRVSRPLTPITAAARTAHEKLRNGYNIPRM